MHLALWPTLRTGTYLGFKWQRCVYCIFVYAVYEVQQQI